MDVDQMDVMTENDVVEPMELMNDLDDNGARGKILTKQGTITKFFVTLPLEGNMDDGNGIGGAKVEENGSWETRSSSWKTGLTKRPKGIQSKTILRKRKGANPTK